MSANTTVDVQATSTPKATILRIHGEITSASERP